MSRVERRMVIAGFRSALEGRIFLAAEGSSRGKLRRALTR